MTPRWRRVACAAHVVPAENNQDPSIDQAVSCPQGVEGLLRCVRAHSVGLACSQLEPFSVCCFTAKLFLDPRIYFSI